MHINVIFFNDKEKNRKMKLYDSFQINKNKNYKLIDLKMKLN